jgi:F-type H+-transporting ATPase subunit b
MLPYSAKQSTGSSFNNIMDAMLHALGGILLRAVPTFLLVVLLHFYLKSVFFKPLEKVLHARYESTEGARKLAGQALEQAAAKTAKYEAALQAAKGELYRSQENLHKQLQEREAAAIAAGRQSAEIAVKQARDLLAEDVEAAKKSLAADSEALANQIADSILRRSAA